MPGQFRGGVITIPGMKTTGAWQKHLVPILQKVGLFCTPVDYGFVVLGAILPKTLDQIAEKIIAAYETQAREALCTQPGAIAHSLGSLGLGHTLKTQLAVHLSNVIVNGCVLRRDYPWTTIVGRGQVERVLNETAGEDRVVRIARIFIRGAGPSGCHGFTDTAGGAVVNRHNEFGRHSDVHSQTHFRTVWVPFLLSSSVDQ